MRTREYMTVSPRPLQMFFLLLTLLSFGIFRPAYAREWQAHLLSQPSSPDSLVAIDKSRQKLFYFRKNTTEQRLDLVSTLPCTTGQVTGDKLKEGDLKTPEGIYFIQEKKESGLNYQLYGDLAFVLNFPNPVDQARGKTGHGIWMHGRGTPIVPYETKGCVALNNKDIRQLQSEVALRSTPVVISDAFSWDTGSQRDTEVSSRLIALTEEWARAWDRKSPKFFSFYDPAYFDRAFKTRKEKLFRQYAWIDVVIDEVHCIEGPDYCVTYFKQLYSAPGFFSGGNKRLYWKKSSGGEWKIIGSEWFESPVDMNAVYDHKLLEDLRPFLEQWRSDWESGDLSAYMRWYAKNAVQGDLCGRQAIREHKRSLFREGKKPARIVLGTPTLSRAGNHIRISCMQEYRSSSGYVDKGVKTLELLRTGENSWSILVETWSSLGS